MALSPKSLGSEVNETFQSYCSSVAINFQPVSRQILVIPINFMLTSLLLPSEIPSIFGTGSYTKVVISSLPLSEAWLSNKKARYFSDSIY